MSDLHALLRACKADPDDDAPRLVLADWLEDHGQSERAAVIRTQVADRRQFLLDRDVPGEWLGEWAGWREGLRSSLDPWENSRVEFPLFHGLFSLWGDEGLFGRVGPMLRPEADWSWIESVSSSCWCSQSYFPIFQRDFSGFLNSGKAHEVTELSFDGDQSGPDVPSVLAASQPLPHLASLSIGFFGQDDRAARTLSKCKTLPGLRRLDLGTNWIGPGGAEAVAGSPNWDRLRHLKLGGNPIRDEGAQAIADGRPRPHLRLLDLGGCELTDDGLFALAASDRFPELAECRLWANKIGPVGVEAVLSSPNFAKAKLYLGIDEEKRPPWVDEFRRKYGDHRL